MADSGSLGVRAELGKVLESEHADLLREGVALVPREVMEMEVARLAGADRYERSGERAAYRCSYVKLGMTGEGASGRKDFARSRRKTTLARWRFRQRSASRRLLPSASLRARNARAE
jgi:transposase-like protein